MVHYVLYHIYFYGVRGRRASGSPDAITAAHGNRNFTRLANVSSKARIEEKKEERWAPHSSDETRKHKHSDYTPIFCKVVVPTRFEPAHEESVFEDMFYNYHSTLVIIQN